MDLLRQLEALLREDVDTVTDKARAQWLDLAGEERPPLVIYGAGHLGRRVAGALSGSAFRVLAFCDADTRKQGTVLDGLPVLSLEEAAGCYGREACFTVCVWRAEGIPHRFPETRHRLQTLGVTHVAQFGHLARVHLPGLLPHYAIDQPGPMLKERDPILEAAELWRDEHSRDRYLRHVLWRLTLDFDLLPDTDPDEIYFPPDLLPPGEGEIIVDAGAFDGDTILLALDKWAGHIREIHAFEPDPVTAKKLQANVRDSPVPIHMHECALGDEEGTLNFQAAGELYSSSGEAGEFKVPCHTLDGLLEQERPTFIKMDIEGGELAALRGARQVLLRCRPRLAICLYHRQNHPWRIPLFLREALPGHQFHLRYHGTDGWELVLYAFPSHA